MCEPLKPPEKFPFPFPPYEIQEQLMIQVFQALEGGKLAILESPTGTGKSLSLICGALTWLHEYNEQQKSRLEKELHAAETAVQQCESADDWFSAAGARQQQTEAVHVAKRRLVALQRHQDKMAAIKARRQKDSQQPAAAAAAAASDSVDQLYKDLAIARNTAKRQLEGRTVDLPSEEQELLLEDDPVGAEEPGEAEEEEEAALKIYYCSRTHSQLSQFVGELQKTVFGGGRTRVAALAARPNLCINPDVAGLKNAALVNDRCLELQKKREGKVTQSCGAEGSAKGTKRVKTTNGCPFHNTSAVRALADQVLCEVTDLEELVKEGRRRGACPYYAARGAVKDAQLVVVPYNSVLQPSTRAACGISLRNNCLIVDEAHNLLATLAAVQELTLSLAQVRGSRVQLQQYLDRYEARLSARNLLHVNQILFCLKAFQSALQPRQAPHTKGVPSFSAADTLLTVASFLADCRVDNINLTQLIKYLDDSHLAQKLHGFAQMFQGTVAMLPPKSASAAEDQTSTASFLSKLKSDKWSNKENLPTVHSPTPLEEEVSYSGNPFLQAVELLRRLVSCNDSGRVLVHRDESLLQQAYIKYVVLDPASHFHELVRECRAVVLAGGTMKPTVEFRQQLFLGAGAPQDRVQEFCCGHVVPPDNILPVAVAAGPTGLALDLTHQSRHNIEMVREVGRVLVNLSVVVPAGVVVFLPSYQYAQYLLDTLRKEGTIDRIAARKKVLEEPRAAADVGSVLDQYATAIRRSSSAAGGGAMLFCVVGGKMSEGINFSDDLGRCVVMVGLPYPNSQAPELRERMRHLDQTQQTKRSSISSSTTESSSTNKSVVLERSPGAAYYHNLCFRAVNQSIGRAIRHRQDYASIVLLDQRYGRPTTVSSLPDWISRGLIVADKFAPALGAISKFFARHKQRYQEQQQQLYHNFK